MTECCLLAYILIANAIIGLIAFEWAWYKVKVIRKGKEEIDKQFPAYRRYDIARWKRWRFMLGAATIMFPRFLLLLAILVLCNICQRIVLIGYKLEDGKAIKGWRGKTVDHLVRLAGIGICFVAGCNIKMKEIKYDYSYYLGKDHDSHTVPPNRVPTYIGNHTSLFDSLVMLTFHKIGFTPKNGLRKAPVMGFILRATGSLFLKRSGSLE